MLKAGDCGGGGGDDDGGGRPSGDAKELPLFLLRVGAAITLSIAGLFFSRLRLRRRPELDDVHGIKCGGRGLKEELRILKNEDTKTKVISRNSVHTITTTTTITTTASVPLPPKCRSLDDDDDGFLLPEFNEMVVEEFGRDMGNITLPAPRVREDTSEENEIYELRDLVRSLQEREKTLKLQLLDFYGLQQQDAAVRELENRLKINNVESELYSLKIESLHSENQRLQTQLSESSKSISKLDATRSKCKLLKKKLRLDAEQAKEKIISLEKMVDSLQCKETVEEEVKAEVEKKLNKLEELENETIELRATNSRLQQETSHLMAIRAHTATSCTQVPQQHGGIEQVNALQVKASDEVDHLRQENEKLAKDVEQLQADRFADVEELVYLKWINACLRHELKDKECPSGKTSARDLSKTLSPKSEHTAKQLIMEYAHVSADERSLSSIEFGSEYASSRASSCGEPDDASIDMSLTTKQKIPKKKEKKKFFSKLRKLVLGKDKENKNVPSLERRVSISSCSFDDFNGRDSRDSYSSLMAEATVSANQQHDNHISLNHSSEAEVKKKATFGLGRFSEFGHSSLKIHKFAEALVTSRSGSMASSRRTASFG